MKGRNVCHQVKEASLFQLYEIPEKAKLCREKEQWLPGLGVGVRLNQQVENRFTGQWKYSAWWSHVIHLSKPIECTIPRVNPELSYGFGVIMTRRYRFIGSKNRHLLLGDVENEGCACVRSAGTWEICVLSSQFCYESKTALK